MRCRSCCLLAIDSHHVFVVFGHVAGITFDFHTKSGLRCLRSRTGSQTTVVLGSDNFRKCSGVLVSQSSTIVFALQVGFQGRVIDAAAVSRVRCGSFLPWLTQRLGIFRRYFTGKDMVEWILANLRTGSNDMYVIQREARVNHFLLSATGRRRSAAASTVRSNQHALVCAAVALE